jgi:hypothetical protein
MRDRLQIEHEIKEAIQNSCYIYLSIRCRKEGDILAFVLLSKKECQMQINIGHFLDRNVPFSYSKEDQTLWIG